MTTGNKAKEVLWAKHKNGINLCKTLYDFKLTNSHTSSILTVLNMRQ